jgi:TnpA family transposase
VTIYGHTADFRLPYHTQVISTNDREVLYVIDGLCNHETDLHVQEHFTHTHGCTTHVFGLCAALGLRFAPRIRVVLDQRLPEPGLRSVQPTADRSRQHPPD